MGNLTIKDALLKTVQTTKEYVDGRFDSIFGAYEPANDDMPRIFFSDGFLPTTKDYTTLKMRYESKTLQFDSYVKIKCQGTSSMAYDKKNFSIRLYEDEALENKLKLDFKGWGEQYKFVLKANYIDLSHARNVVSAKLWGKCVAARSNFDELPQLLKEAPNLGAIDGFFCRVFHEGIYQGRYTFNIPKDPWMTNMDEDNEQHCLLCAEDYNSSCFRAPAVIDETDWTDEIHDTVPESIKTRWNEVISFVMNSSDEDFKNNLSSYFDIESLIDYYCFQYLICGLDSMGKNQIYITYDGNLWLATAYDMDSTWGLYWDGQHEVSTAFRMQEDFETMAAHGTSNLLYDRLEKLFVQEIYDRYQVLRNGPMSITNVVAAFEEFVSVCTPDMIAEDYEIFPGIPGQSFNNIKQIRKYAVDRFNYVDDCIEEMITTGITANKLYELPQPTVFAGSNYVDTGIKLFDTAKDWTLILHGHMDNLYQDHNTAMLHCMYEGDDGDYPGLSIQAIGDEGFAFLGAPTGQYFPAQSVNTNSFKIALVCEKGMITKFKTIRNHGYESYKSTNGSYRQVTKNLTLGAYQDESMNYGRYFNGTFYSCIVYDQALSGGQINYVLNNLNAALRFNFNPNGQAFSDNTTIDWSAQELVVSCDLTSCTNSGGECILSFGENIDSWAGNNVHFYYNPSTDNMLIQCMQGGAAQNINITITGNMTVKFNSDGLTVNDTLYPTANYATFRNILAVSNIRVGSTEGTNRSNASNYSIEIKTK